jgi:peptidoglycan-N-acetylglucosamine deacetylase
VRGLAPVRHGPRDSKLVALTFDDGPGRLTEAVLDVLARRDARATFNVLGERVAGREGMLRRTVAAGHEVGSHAFRHDRLAGRPADAYRQLRRTGAAIVAATGVKPRVFRPPYGSASPGVVLAGRLAGLVTVAWDVDPHDYDTPGADVIIRRMIRRVKPGSIVLLHDDRRAMVQTVEALDPALGELAGRGYRFVTVSELLGLDRRAR